MGRPKPSTVSYHDDVGIVTAAGLSGFFVGWPNPPSPRSLHSILTGSSHVWLAMVDGRAVGLVTAVSDGFFAASIPLLEVLPEFQGRGIGQRLHRNS